MAPRTAKTKKAADVKVAENEVPKKGKGKGKIVEDPEPEIIDAEDSEKALSVVDKKTKRGKKGSNNTNGDEQVNGTAEESAPLAKKGRKKNVEPPTKEENSVEDESGSLPEDLDENGDSEEAQTVLTGRGRKKQTKPEVEKKDTGRGRKNAKTVEVTEKVDASEAKPKPVAKGRGRKAQVKDDDQDAEENVETVEEKPATKGRKKGAKVVKEKSPESEKGESPEHEQNEEEEEAVEEPKKKGKKIQKKVKEVEDKDEAPAFKKRKVNKTEDKGKGDSKDNEEVIEDLPETKITKGKRGAKKPVETPADDEEPQDTGEPTTKRRRKAADDKAPVDDLKRKAPPKNKATTDYSDIDFSNSSKNSIGKEWNIKIASWNVDGIRAWLNKGGMEYINSEKPDILCLQEIKCSQDKLPDEIANLPGYHAYWLCSEKDGYAGVGIYTTKLAMSVQYGLQNEELDTEGRIITAEYEQFYLICTYVPNAGRKLVTLPKRLQWNEEFGKYVKELDKIKPVIICGDMNVAHNEIDLANPKTNKKNAGFTEEERAGMTELLGSGFVDTFRHLNPDKTGAYTFWTYMSNSRSKNVGWRLDYFIVSERLLPSLCDNVIRDQVYGSDHCPITLFLHLSTADKPKE